MFALFRSRWLLLTVAVPLGAWALDRVAAQVEQRSGETNVTRAMRWPHERRQRRRAAA
jgi:hypothetical protein